MKNVLIIAYYGYNHRRIYGLAKYLPEFGWQPIILTMPLKEKPALPVRVIETPRDTLTAWERLIGVSPDKGNLLDMTLKEIRGQIEKRVDINTWINPILARVSGVLNYPDSIKGWKTLAVKAGMELLHQENIHAIISSNPVTSHLIARELKASYDIPWIADFRDLWSLNHAYSPGAVRKWMDKRLEIKTLTRTDALIAVSPPMTEKLKQLHKGKPVYSIPNGFDPVEVNTPPVKLTDSFTITYGGTIYTGKQDPVKLLAALRDLIDSGTINRDVIELRFYGNSHNWLDRQIKQYGLANLVKQYGPVVRDVVLDKQRESQLLLIMDWEDTKERGVYPAKIFDYLAARRPILAIGGSRDSVVGGLLAGTKAGTLAPDVADIKRTLTQYYQEFKQKGEVAYHGDESEINRYSHREMARQFAEIIEYFSEKQGKK